MHNYLLIFDISEHINLPLFLFLIIRNKLVHETAKNKIFLAIKMVLISSPSSKSFSMLIDYLIFPIKKLQ